jgi:asparagine synthase (glutamine-hydrolysing)
MCGIAGIVKIDPRQRPDEARLKRMRDALRHRGPDGEGVIVDGPAGLGHRRLAIVDVAGGAQPMANEDGSVVLVCNGEIYNHAALRSGLEARGHRFRSRSDSETILHLYEEEGERCVETLRGMFAFALWDRRRGRLLLARDRLGIKPLYVARTDGEILFASEIKAILAAGGLRAEMNEAILPEYLATRFVSGEETFFRGVRKILPGRTFTWSAEEGARVRRYWSLPPPAGCDEDTGAPTDGTRGRSPQRIEAAAGEVRERLAAAVESHLMSDVPLGLFLSGGLDSSGLLGLMAGMTREPIRTFSVGFAEREANELEYARMAARAAGAEHREVIVTPEEFFGVLPSLVWHEDEPIAFPSSVPLHFVSRMARDHVKVVLTGEGADELFLGYDRHRVTAWNERLGRAYDHLVPAPIRRGAGRLAALLPGRPGRLAARSFLTLGPSLRDRFFENFAPFPAPARRGILAGSGLLAGRDPFGEAVAAGGCPGGDLLDRMSRVEIETHLVELLMKQDQMSMSASIESRVPFLDHPFVEYVAALPGTLKLRGLRTKVVLRAALRGLVPPAILERRKMGFPVPVGRFLRGRFWPVVQEFVLGPRALARGFFDPAALRRLADEHRAGARNHGDRLWLLLNLEIWQRIFLEGEDPAAIMSRAGRSGAGVAARPGRPRAISGTLLTGDGGFPAPSLRESTR